ncbi:MAG TPA: hypothetical protein VGO11_13905 [Chthoniobacteraceae bacterium]|nr:hypothetical protein [Chthoniobacteraceae bacterium]
MLEQAVVPGFLPPSFPGGGPDEFDERFKKFCASLGRFSGSRPPILSKDGKDEHGNEWSDGDLKLVKEHFFAHPLQRAADGYAVFAKGSNAAVMFAALTVAALNLGFTILDPQHIARGLPEEDVDLLHADDPWIKTYEDLKDLFQDFISHLDKGVIRNFWTKKGPFEAYAFGRTTVRRFVKEQWWPKTTPVKGGRTPEVERFVPTDDRAFFLASCLEPKFRQALFLAVHGRPEDEIPKMAEEAGAKVGDGEESGGTINKDDAAALAWGLTFRPLWSEFSDDEYAVFYPAFGVPKPGAKPDEAKTQKATYRRTVHHIRTAHEFLWLLTEASEDQAGLVRVQRVLTLLGGRRPALERPLRILVSTSPGSRLPLNNDESAEFTARRRACPRPDRPWEDPLPRELFESVRAGLSDEIGALPLFRMLLTRAGAVHALRPLAALLPGGSDADVQQFYFCETTFPSPWTDEALQKVVEFAPRLDRLFAASARLNPAPATEKDEVRLGNLCELLPGTDEDRKAIYRLLQGAEATLPAPSQALSEGFELILQALRHTGTPKRLKKLEPMIGKVAPDLQTELETLLVLGAGPATEVALTDHERQIYGAALKDIFATLNV